MKKYLSLIGLIFIINCSGQKINNYQAANPPLDMYHFFDGNIKGWGMFQKRNGEVQKRFTVDIMATHQKKHKTIILNEQFDWDDGTQSERIWTLVKQVDDTWKGTAADVIGEATGIISGNTLQWEYVLALPVKDSIYNVHFDDWMYLIDNNVMLNRSTMSKWGIELGSVTLSLHRVN